MADRDTEKTVPDRYLGDGVYASFDGYQVWLTTLGGYRIAVEPTVFDALADYYAEVRSRPTQT